MVHPLPQPIKSFLARPVLSSKWDTLETRFFTDSARGIIMQANINGFTVTADRYGVELQEMRGLSPRKHRLQLTYVRPVMRFFMIGVMIAKRLDNEKVHPFAELSKV